MKRIILISIFSACIAGCITKNSSVSTFNDLRQQVKYTLGPDYECSSIMTSEVGTNLYFEVKSQHSSLPVTVTKREFIAPKEWRKHFQADTNTIAEFLNYANAHATNSIKEISTITNQPFFEQFSNILDFPTLPRWHYQNISVDVGFSEPDIVYPGVEQNIKGAQDTVDKIVSCLESY